VNSAKITPSSEELLAELERILNALQDDPQGPVWARFETVFAIPQQAVLAAVQLVCPNCNARLARRVRESTMDRWLNRIALNPEQNQSRDGILNIFEEFRREGSFGNFP